MDLSETESVIRQFHTRLWGELDSTAIEEFVHPDATTIMTGFEGSTLDVLHEDVARYQGAYDDVSTEILHVIVDGERAAMWWRTVGTHVGPYGTIAPQPTGKVIEMSGVVRYRVEHGLITEMASFWDAAAVYRQFGLLREDL